MLVTSQCDALIQAIRAREEQLLLTVRAEKERKQDVYKDQLTHCSKRLQRATGLLQFSIEALKENDAGAFLQVRAAAIVPSHNATACFSGSSRPRPVIHMSSLDESLALIMKIGRHCILDVCELKLVQFRRRLVLDVMIQTNSFS